MKKPSPLIGLSNIPRKPIALSSSKKNATNKPKSRPLALMLPYVAYIFMLFIPELICTVSSVSLLKNKQHGQITQL